MALKRQGYTLTMSLKSLMAKTRQRTSPTKTSLTEFRIGVSYRDAASGPTLRMTDSSMISLPPAAKESLTVAVKAETAVGCTGAPGWYLEAAKIIGMVKSIAIERMTRTTVRTAEAGRLSFDE